MSVDAIKKLFAASREHYATTHRKMLRADNLYNRRYRAEIRLPKGVPVHETSTPAMLVDSLRDQIRVDEPKVSALAFGKSKQAKTSAELQQMWGQSIMLGAAQDSLMDPFGQARFDLLLRGAGAVKWNAKDDHVIEPEQRKGESRKDFKKRHDEWQFRMGREQPFSLKAVDPLTLYPSPGSGPTTYMLEVQERRVLDVWDRYPAWSDPKAKHLSPEQRDNPLRPVKWMSYWSWHWDTSGQKWEGEYVVLVDDEPVIEKDNPYRQVPYAFSYSGLGRVNYDGDPSFQAVGLLDQIAGELEAEVRLKTAMDAQWQFHVFPRAKVWGMSAKDAAKKFAVGPAAMIEMPGSKATTDIEWMEVAPPGAGMYRFLDEIKTALDRKVSPSLSGERAADFGIQQALQIGQALKVVGPVIQSLNKMATDTVSKLADLTHTLDLDLTVRARDVGERKVPAKDLESHIFEVKFEAIDPVENDRRMLAALSVVGQGLMSRETFFEKYLRGIIESPDDEEERLMTQAVVDQLVSGGILLQTAMGELALLQEESKVEGAIGEATDRVRNTAASGGSIAAQAGGAERTLEEVTGGGQVSTEGAQAGFEGAGVS